MTFPNIPNVTPTISMTRSQVVNLLLASVAFEELGLAHLINAEAEKIQAVVGTLPGTNLVASSIADLVNINKSVNRTLKTIIKKEMLLQFKLEEIFSISTETTSTSTTSTTSSTTSTSTASTTTTSTASTSTTTTPAPCGCMATNEAGKNFDIKRGTGASDTIVIFNEVIQPSNSHGSVTYNGHLCLNCTSNNEFTFTYGGDADISPFIFTATTFTIPHCENQIVIVTGQGTTNNTLLFGSNPVTYTLILNGVMGSKSITLTIVGSNGATFTATTTNLGNGELVVTNCP